MIWMDSAACQLFLVNCLLLFTLYPNTHPTDQNNVADMIILLTENAGESTKWTVIIGSDLPTLCLYHVKHF